MLNKNIFLILFIIAVTISSFSCKAKPVETAVLETKISGRVVDKDNDNFLQGVQITTNPVTTSVMTDAAGTYTIPDVTKGQYIVTASKSGYKASWISVVVTEGKTANADLKIELLKPELGVSLPSIDFGTTETVATFILSNTTSIETINYSITKNVDWLAISSTSGTITNGTATIAVSISRTNLAFGNYSTILSITSNGGNKDVNVIMTVANPNAPQLTVSPLLLDFSTNLSQLTFTVRNTGTGKFDWLVSSSQQWISVLPTKDSTRTETDQISVTINRGSLPPADYAGEIVVTSNAGSQIVKVKMNVPAVPSLSLSTNSLDFDSSKTQLSFNVTNGGTGSLSWNVSGNLSWMNISPSSGTNSGTINVTTNRVGLIPGSYSGIISIISNGGNGLVTVNMKVIPQPKPVTVAVGNAKTNSIQLSWTQYAESDFSVYKIYYSTSSTVSENSTLATTINDKTVTSFTVSGLSLGTTYYFKVYVSSLSQQTAGSNTVSATTTSALPSWQQVALPANFQVQSMHYISESNIWVAGYTTISTYNFPRIYQFNGSQWVQSNIQGQDSVGTLSAIAFKNNTEGWAASGSYKKIYKFNGTNWVVYQYLEKLPSGFGYGIPDAVGTTTDVWFYGAKGGSAWIYRWNGNEFTEWWQTSASNIDDLHFYNSTTGFAISYFPNSSFLNTYMFNGTGWIDLGKIIYTGGYSISGTSKTDVWASDGTYLYHYDGTNWKRQNDIGGVGIKYYFGQIRMISPTEGWALCRQSPYDVYYYNGTTWTKVGSVSGSITEIKDFGNGNLWGLMNGTLMRLK